MPWNMLNHLVQPGTPLTEHFTTAPEVAQPRPSFTCNLPTFDGRGQLDAYLMQFVLATQASGWDDTAEIMALASHLRGRACDVLFPAANTIDTLTSDVLVSALRDWLGSERLRHPHHARPRHRTQQPGESLSALAADINQLCRKMFDSCPPDSLNHRPGLQDPSLLCLAQVVTLRDALACAVEIESAHQTTQAVLSRRVHPEWQNASNSVQCYMCLQYGHYARRSRER